MALRAWRPSLFEIHETAIPGVRELRASVRPDPRGRFVKTFHAGFFAEHGLAADFREQYYSVSEAGVLRGLHFQAPPADHAKLVCCTAGAVLDVALDLRIGSPAFGRHVALTLSAENAAQAYIPPGCAHGFCVTEGPATLVYAATTEYAPEFDAGVLWNSAGIDWPIETPTLSERDAALPPLGEFDSPFSFED